MLSLPSCDPKILEALPGCVARLPFDAICGLPFFGFPVAFHVMSSCSMATWCNVMPCKDKCEECKVSRLSRCHVCHVCYVCHFCQMSVTTLEDLGLEGCCAAFRKRYPADGWILHTMEYSALVRSWGWNRDIFDIKYFNAFHRMFLKKHLVLRCLPASVMQAWAWAGTLTCQNCGFREVQSGIRAVAV